MEEVNGGARLSSLLDIDNEMVVELAKELLDWLSCSVAELTRHSAPMSSKGCNTF
jgi:hypothetical protein